MSKIEPKKTYKLTIISNGKSKFNKGNFFTGWRDVELTLTGIKEAYYAGKIYLTYVIHLH